MRNIIALPLLSIFMAMPAMAERKFLEGAKFVSTPATGDPQGYKWELLVNSVWISAGETPGPQFIITGPLGTKIHPRVVPVIHADPPYPPTNTYPEGYPETGSIAGPLISDPSIKFSIYPDFDFDNNGVVGTSDYGYFANNWGTLFSIEDYGMFVNVFGYKIVNREYIKPQ